MSTICQVMFTAPLQQVDGAELTVCGPAIANALTLAPCRSRQDELVFALHAAVLASGYRLVAVGEQADLESMCDLVTCRAVWEASVWAVASALAGHLS